MNEQIKVASNGMLAKILTGVTIAMVVAGLSGAIGLYVQAQGTADRVHSLESQRNEHTRSGHGQAFEALRGDVRQLTTKIEAGDRARAQDLRALEQRLGRIESALERLEGRRR